MDAKHETCRSCNGTGEIEDLRDGPNFPATEKCPTCNGTGQVLLKITAVPPTLYGIASQLIADRKLTRARAVSLMLAERTEQETAHGYTVETDRVYRDQQLENAATSYLLCQSIPSDVGSGRAPDMWPWAPNAFKPHPEDRLKELTKAAALVLAAMEQEIIKRGDKS